MMPFYPLETNFGFEKQWVNLGYKDPKDLATFGELCFWYHHANDQGDYEQYIKSILKKNINKCNI